MNDLPGQFQRIRPGEHSATLGVRTSQASSFTKILAQAAQGSALADAIGARRVQRKCSF